MKRINILLLTVLAAAIGLFGAYQLWIHNRLDTVGPVITVDEAILEISVNDPEEALMQGIRAVDARDGDVTPSLLVESIYGINEDNQTTVTYAAFDRAGNVTKLQRQVRYRDYRSPRLELYGSLCFPSVNGFDLLEYVGANDVREGNINRRVRATLVSDTKDISEVGSHIVRFQVTNSIGDTVVMDLPVEVYDPEWYTAAVELEEYLVYLDRGAAFDRNDYLKSFAVRGQETDISNGVPEGIICNISGDVNTNVPGVYTVTYTMTTTQSMMTFSGQAVLIVIVEN